MPSLDTTNMYLGILAGTAAIELLLVVGAIIWMLRWGMRLERTLVAWEANHLIPLRARADALIADLHVIANNVARVGNEVEKTASRARSIVDVVGREVERTAQRASSALDAVEQGFHRIRSVGLGIGNGLRTLLSFSRPRRLVEPRHSNNPRHSVNIDSSF